MDFWQTNLAEVNIIEAEKSVLTDSYKETEREIGTKKKSEE